MYFLLNMWVIFQSHVSFTDYAPEFFTNGCTVHDDFFQRYPPSILAGDRQLFPSAQNLGPQC